MPISIALAVRESDFCRDTDGLGAMTEVCLAERARNAAICDVRRIPRLSHRGSRNDVSGAFFTERDSEESVHLVGTTTGRNDSVCEV